MDATPPRQKIMFLCTRTCYKRRVTWYKRHKIVFGKNFTKEDIKDVIHKPENLSDEIIERIIRVHRKHTTSEFRHSHQHNKEFNYPSYLMNDEGDLQNDYIKTDFWNEIHKIPTKARHNNSYITVVGRMDKYWANTLLLLISKLILMMRLIPKNTNIPPRVPIPKPEKPNEYRPLSVCNDLFCFVNNEYSKHAAAAMERANTLHDAVTTYRKGKGCSSLVVIELSAREDRIESGKLSALIMEDMEFFSTGSLMK